MKPKKIVLVRWVDSASRQGWVAQPEANSWKHAFMEISTVGYVYSDTDEGLTLCQSYDSNPDPHVGGMFQIPRGCIKHVQAIAYREKPKKKK